MILGLLGGGQLAQMTTMTAKRMGIAVVVLDPSPTCPAVLAGATHVQGALDDAQAIAALARQVNVIALDTEHVEPQALKQGAGYVPVYPHPDMLATINDRLLQRQWLESLGLPQPVYASVGSVHDLPEALKHVGGQGVLKLRRSGYDGKGQAWIRCEEDMPKAHALLKHGSAVLECVVPYVREISCLAARNPRGDVAVYEPACNHHLNGILHTTHWPWKTALANDAQEITKTIVNAMQYAGVMCVEYFEHRDGMLWINEIAPRPHNSGHVTWGASMTSQFEQHVRGVMDWPLGKPTVLCHAAMLNVLGDAWAYGEPSWMDILALSGTRLHLYGKEDPRPGRKMGHVLVLDTDAKHVDERLRQVINVLQNRAGDLAQDR